MPDNARLGPWLRRFLLEHLVHERSLPRNRQWSYRDTLALLVPFVGGQTHVLVDRLTIVHVSADLVRRSLRDLEDTRGCSTATRNQRLAVLHALARFVGERSPEHLEWAGQICAIPFKKYGKTPVTYLEKPEMGGALGVTRSRHRTRTTRSHPLAVSLQHRRAC